MAAPRNSIQHAQALIALGLPLIGSHLAQVAIGVTDTLMMGWYDVTELAAVVLATSFFFVLFLMGSGFALAVSPMVAAASAQGDIVQARRTTRMGVWLTLAFAAISLPLMIWSGPLLRLLGQTAEISDLAQQYLRIAVWGMVPALVVMALKSFLTALERTQIVFWVTVFAALANAGLNYVLIFGKFGAPEETKRVLRAAFREALPARVVARQKASFPLPFQAWVEDLPRDLTPLQTKQKLPERQLLGGPSKQEELEEEAHRKRKMQQMELVIGNLARDDEMRNLEATMNDIGNSVEEINENINSKLAEFTDMIERLKSQKMVNKKIMRLPRE